MQNSNSSITECLTPWCVRRDIIKSSPSTLKKPDKSSVIRFFCLWESLNSSFLSCLLSLLDLFHPCVPLTPPFVCIALRPVILPSSLMPKQRDQILSDRSPFAQIPLCSSLPLPSFKANRWMNSLWVCKLIHTTLTHRTDPRLWTVAILCGVLQLLGQNNRDFNALNRTSLFYVLTHFIDCTGFIFSPALLSRNKARR